MRPGTDMSIRPISHVSGRLHANGGSTGLLGVYRQALMTQRSRTSRQPTKLGRLVRPRQHLPSIV